jgi:hypothetical protein
MSNTMEWEQWKLLAARAMGEHGYSEEAVTFADWDGTWRDYYNDGMTPSEAVEEDEDQI